MNIRVKFKVSIVAILTSLVVLVGASISGLFWFTTSEITENIAQGQFENQTNSAEESFTSLLVQAGMNAAVGAAQPNVNVSPAQFLDAEVLPVAIEALRQQEAFYSVYYGFDDGTFFQIIATRGLASILEQHQAPAETAWIVRAIVEDGERVQKWAFLDEQKNLLGERQEPSPEYNPTKRPWYIAAAGNRQVQLSEPYLFNSLQKPGITASRSLDGAGGVYGVDLTLEGVTNEVSALPISENGGLILHDRNDRLIALSTRFGQADPMADIHDIDIPAMKVFLSVGDSSISGLLQKTTDEGEDFFVSREEVSYAGMDFYIGAIAPVRDFNGEFVTLQNRVLLISLVSLILFIPFSYVFASNLSKKVTDLTGAANQMREMNFDVKNLKNSHIVEFDELIHSFSDMSHSLGDKTEQLNESQAKLSRLVDLGISMAAEQSSDKLMEMVLLGAKDMTNADGCSLYVINKDDKLEFKIFRNDSLGIGFGGTMGDKKAFQDIPLYREDGSQNESNVVSYAVHAEKTINVDDVEMSEQFDFTGPRSFDVAANYKTKSILTVPLKPRGGSVIGALQIVNARDKNTGQFIAFSTEVQPFVEALAAQAATSLYNRHLLEAQENLMDALILLIAEAIDSKSPYTGGHCERVPVLAMKLAEKASKESAGSYADFSFKTHDEWREFEIGAWLHDCGKIVTPEYVVDKASKLETIYNRIHEIRTRFEVLLRDARIDSLQAIVEGDDRDDAEARYETRKQALVDDFSFVAECNIGGEFMGDDDIARLKQIAETVWQRNFDIKLGLAHEEALRFSDAPDAPCPEKLLDDKPYHIIPRTRHDDTKMAERGFKIDIPDDLYNQGEVYNLSIRRGTLTAEERYKINEHIVQSIIMLEQLPLPRHLQRVPEYAGTHHETMIGTGYPRKLTADELSIPARIMAIADIFEALTASDRPYKKSKTLSEAIKILSFFKKDQHIDGDLFDLFLTSGIYKEYAEMFLKPEQIDEVDINQYIG